jgi:hypothetical protein
VKELEAEIDAAWFGIKNGYDIESRAELEAQSKTNGFKYGLPQAVHHIWKREPKIGVTVLTTSVEEQYIGGQKVSLPKYCKWCGTRIIDLLWHLFNEETGEPQPVMKPGCPFCNRAFVRRKPEPPVVSHDVQGNEE